MKRRKDSIIIIIKLVYLSFWLEVYYVASDIQATTQTVRIPFSGSLCCQADRWPFEYSEKAAFLWNYKPTGTRVRPTTPVELPHPDASLKKDDKEVCCLLRRTSTTPWVTQVADWKFVIRVELYDSLGLSVDCHSLTVVCLRLSVYPSSVYISPSYGHPVVRCRLSLYIQRQSLSA